MGFGQRIFGKGIFVMARKRRLSSLRMPGHDYSDPGDYFITICTYQRDPWLCEIEHTLVMLTSVGRIVERCWYALPAHYPHVQLSAFVIMPNHIHGIITLTQRTNDEKRHGLSEIIRWLKAVSAQHINLTCSTEGQPRWQRGFYDVIIRYPRHYAAIKQYIGENPLRWELDRLHPHHPNPFLMDDE
jgi:putative transposase